MVTINIGRKEAVFFGVIILVFVVAGLAIAFGGSQPSVMGHSAEELEGVCLSDGSGCPSSLSNGEVRVWQNMGPTYTQDSRTHLTSCDSGYLMSGLRVFAASALDGFMTAHCTESSLSLSGSTIKGPLGNLDNQFYNLNCDSDQVIRSISVYSSAYFDYDLKLDCGILIGASLDNSNSVWAANLYGGENNDLYDSELNSIYDSETLIIDCPVGYVAVGIRAYASSYIENFDILCKKII